MYFYELSESDDDILANLFLGHDSEYDEQEFLDLVLEAREAVLKAFEEDSLIEAIATACSPPPHRRSSCMPATSIGNPACSAIHRPVQGVSPLV